jgi:hypothetical protein
MKLHHHCFILILSLLSCKEHTTEPSPSEPYQRWQSYTIHNYTMNQIRECYCVEGGTTMEITIRSDTVSKVLRLPDSTVVTGESVKWYLPIDSLFGIIRHSTFDSLVVTYNTVYGYPEVVDINPQLHPVDGGVVYRIVSFQIP